MSTYIRAFNRFELKYLLHHQQTREFLDRISAHVHSDPNAGRDGFYKVVSLYFDSPDFMCYWEKLDGEKYRRKIRVRTYGERPTDAFVEIKQRLNYSVQKRRCRVPVDTVMEDMRSMELGGFEPGVDPVLDEVYNLRRRYHWDPRLIISYNRAAFFDNYKKDLRITVDRNIRCRNLDLSLTQHRMRGPWAVPPDYNVLEVKFNEAMPRWVCTCLNAMDLQVVRLSKYCEGVDRLRLQG